MKATWRVLLLAIAFGVLYAPAATAQMECYQCDPWGSCWQECWYCQTPHPDYCPQFDVVYTTCGDYMGACMEDNCTPNWQETDRDAIGTYGESIDAWACYLFGDCECRHHTVYRVTETDSNQCNTSSYYWTRQYCDDVTDGWKYGPTQPDCCDGNPSFFTCNHWHSCF